VPYIGWIYTLARNTQIPNRDFMLSFLFSGSSIPLFLFSCEFREVFLGRKALMRRRTHLKITNIEESVASKGKRKYQFALNFGRGGSMRFLLYSFLVLNVRSRMRMVMMKNFR